MKAKELRSVLAAKRADGTLRHYDTCIACQQPLGVSDRDLTVDAAGALLHSACAPATNRRWWQR